VYLIFSLLLSIYIHRRASLRRELDAVRAPGYE